MQHFILEIRQALGMLNDYDWVVATAAVAAAAVLIREMLDSAVLATLSIPLMLIGALAFNYLFQTTFISPVDDKDTNVVIASSVGVLVAVCLLLVCLWIISVMSEFRSKHKKLLKLPPAEPDR